jgi:hypothetical protein
MKLLNWLLAGMLAFSPVNSVSSAPQKIHSQNYTARDNRGREIPSLASQILVEKLHLNYKELRVFIYSCLFFTTFFKQIF